MTRFSAAAVISILLALFTPFSAHAQSSTCPAGYELNSDSDTAGSGTCVKTHAQNCLGGELTVDGKCLCNGQVVMSGETYLLEYVRGKCVPKLCPVQTLAREGKCLAGGDEPAPSKEANAAHRRHHHFWLGAGSLRRFYYRIHHDPARSY